MGNGRTVSEVVYRNSVSAYDWETEQNDAKRSIKLIKPEYYQQIMREFKALTGADNLPYIRKLR
jgi:hypothetical protein